MNIVVVEDTERDAMSYFVTRNMTSAGSVFRFGRLAKRSLLIVSISLPWAYLGDRR